MGLTLDEAPKVKGYLTALQIIGSSVERSLDFQSGTPASLNETVTLPLTHKLRGLRKVS